MNLGFLGLMGLSCVTQGSRYRSNGEGIGRYAPALDTRTGREAETDRENRHTYLIIVNLQTNRQTDILTYLHTLRYSFSTVHCIIYMWSCAQHCQAGAKNIHYLRVVHT